MVEDLTKAVFRLSAYAAMRICRKGGVGRGVERLEPECFDRSRHSLTRQCTNKGAPKGGIYFWKLPFIFKVQRGNSKVGVVPIFKQRMTRAAENAAMHRLPTSPPISSSFPGLRPRLPLSASHGALPSISKPHPPTQGSVPAHHRHPRSSAHLSKKCASCLALLFPPHPPAPARSG